MHQLICILVTVLSKTKVAKLIGLKEEINDALKINWQNISKLNPAMCKKILLITTK